MSDSHERSGHPEGETLAVARGHLAPHRRPRAGRPQPEAEGLARRRALRGGDLLRRRP